MTQLTSFLRFTLLISLILGLACPAFVFEAVAADLTAKKPVSPAASPAKAPKPATTKQDLGKPFDPSPKPTMSAASAKQNQRLCSISSEYQAADSTFPEGSGNDRDRKYVQDSLARWGEIIKSKNSNLAVRHNELDEATGAIIEDPKSYLYPRHTFWKVTSEAIWEICQFKWAMEKSINTHLLAQKTSINKIGVNSKAAFQELENTHRQSSAIRNSYAGKIKSHLYGKPFQGKTPSSLLKLYDENYSKNYKRITQVDTAKLITEKYSPSMKQKVARELAMEVKDTWGKPIAPLEGKRPEIKESFVPLKNMDPKSGLISKILVMIDQEREDAESLAAQSDEYAKDMGEKAANLVSTSAATAAASAVTGRENAADLPPPPPRAKPGVETPPAVEAAGHTTSDPDLRNDERGPPRPSADTPPGDDDPPPPAVDTPPATPEEVGGKSGSGVGGWLSDNSGWLIPVGLVGAGVGGYYLYNRHQQKKEEKNWELKDDIARLQTKVAARSNSAGSSSGNGTTTVTITANNIYSPQGSQLLIESAPSGTVSAGQSLTDIRIKIVDRNGVGTLDNLTDVTVSCVTPSPCSLTGTLRVTSNQGVATFSGLKFTEGHTGVVLRFSAPGFNSVTMSNSINVTGPTSNGR